MKDLGILKPFFPEGFKRVPPSSLGMQSPAALPISSFSPLTANYAAVFFFFTPFTAAITPKVTPTATAATIRITATRRMTTR